jgi:hypothetical protein
MAPSARRGFASAAGRTTYLKKESRCGGDQALQTFQLEIVP